MPSMNIYEIHEQLLKLYEIIKTITIINWNHKDIWTSKISFVKSITIKKLNANLCNATDVMNIYEKTTKTNTNYIQNKHLG